MKNVIGMGFILGALSLAGCGGGWTPDPSNHLPPQDPILSDGTSRPQTPYQGPGLYCYRTLAEPDCHLKPLDHDPNNPNRLIGSYPPSETPPGTKDQVPDGDDAMDRVLKTIEDKKRQSSIK